MLKVFENGADITQFIQYKTLSIKEALSNRRNTASFTSVNHEIAEGKIIEIFEGSEIKQNISAGVFSVIVDDTFSDSEKYKKDDIIILWINTVNAEKIKILSVDNTTKTITFATAAQNAHTNGDFLWFKKFGWVVIRTPDKNIGASSFLEYSVEVSDFGGLFDKKNIVDTYADMYPREIFWRFIYKFCATDTSKVLFDFESVGTITASGVATTPTLDSADRIAGTNSVKIWASEAGDAIYTITFASIDCSNLKHFRFWAKYPAAADLKIISGKFRIWNDASNYFEFSDVVILKDHWSYDSFEILVAKKVWSPNLATIEWAQIIYTTNAAVQINLDELTATSGGFTLKNSDLWPKKMTDVRVQYKKPTVLTDAIAKTFKLYWFIDYNRDLNFYAQDKMQAPFVLTNTSQNFDNLSVQADIASLKNRQVVRWGIAPDQNRYEQERFWDDVTESWFIDYLASDLKVYTDLGAGYVLRTVWVENLVDATTVDYLFNYQEKVVRRSQAAILTAGQKIKIDYIPYRPVRVQVQDAPSIAFMKALTWGDGIYDGAVINDSSIKDYDSARDRAKAELQTYSNPILTASFITEKDGLTIGQTLYITDTNRGLTAQPFIIQTVNVKQKSDDRFVYTVNAGSTLYGITEFFQYLLKKTADTEIDENELVDIVITIDEVLEIADNYVFTQKTPPFYAMWPTPGMTPNDAYADFSETA